MYFLLHLRDRQNYMIDVDSQERRECCTFVAVDFRDNSPGFEDFALGVLHPINLNDLMEYANGAVKLHLFLLSKVKECL